jgi:hypothetical protein
MSSGLGSIRKGLFDVTSEHAWWGDIRHGRIFVDW